MFHQVTGPHSPIKSGKTRDYFITISVLIFITLTGISCGENHLRANQEQEGLYNTPLKVVTTVSPITSLVENIGGTRISLVGIIPEGVNSHTFEPAPSIAKIISEADLIVLNGLFLEEPSLEMARVNKKDKAIILLLADKAIDRADWIYDFSFQKSGGHPNPHLWTSPILALKYAELIRDTLTSLDSTNSTYFNDNYEKLEARLTELDAKIYEAIQTIPSQNRKLLTYHDSFPFFAKRYGLEIIGAVQPSDFTEPSAREVANLIEQIKDYKIPAIFGSEVFPSPVMEQIAKEGNSKYVDQLRDDDLPGSHGDLHHTYLGLMVANIKVMVPALGGNSDSISDFDATVVFDGDSNAKYPE